MIVFKEGKQTGDLIYNCLTTIVSSKSRADKINLINQSLNNFSNGIYFDMFKKENDFHNEESDEDEENEDEEDEYEDDEDDEEDEDEDVEEEDDYGDDDDEEDEEEEEFIPNYSDKPFDIRFTLRQTVSVCLPNEQWTAGTINCGDCINR